MPGINGKGGNFGREGKWGNGKAGIKPASSWPGGKGAGGGGVIIGCWSGIGSAGSMEPGGVCVSWSSGNGKVGFRR